MQGNCTACMMKMSDQVDLLLTDFKDFCYTKLETLIETDEYNTSNLNNMK